MAPRPNWKGFLKLSFVSCPIALYPAVSAAERVSFRQVNKRTGHRLRHRLVDSITGEAVESSDKGRGYEVGENEFMLVEEGEIEQARQTRPQPDAASFVALPRQTKRPAPSLAPVEEPESEPDPEDEEVQDSPVVARPQNTHTIEIERFLAVGQIDARYHEKPYYIVPREPVGQEAFAVIREAMRAQSMAGLGRVVLSSRERPILIAPLDKGLCGITLRFAHEVRTEADYFSDVPELILPPDALKLAKHIIETKAADFDPSMLEDHCRNALVELLRRKQAERPAPSGPVNPASENIVSLMDALRRSITADETTPVKKPPAPSQKQRNKKVARPGQVPGSKKKTA